MATAESVASQLRGLVNREKHRAMSRAVLIAEAQAKREAPVKRGTLRRSITSRVEQGGNRGVVGTNLSYARPVHDGSKKHIIRPKNKRALFWKGARHPVKVVRHPGNRANPFLRRAMNVARPRIERELAGHFDTVLGRIR